MAQTLDSDDIFLARKFWIPNEEAQNCFSCITKFFPPFILRHHCRICGKVFCSRCSNNFLSPPEYQFENEKSIRVCDHCLKTTQQRNAKKRRTIGIILRRKIGNKDASHPEPNHNYTETSQALLYQKISGYYDILMQENMNTVFKNHLVSEDWKQTLKELLFRIATEVKPETVDGKDSIDINKKVRIKTLVCNDDSKAKYIEGIAIKKVITQKKLAKELDNPRILMFSAPLGIDGDDTIVNLESFIDKNDELERKLVKNVLKFRPNLILVENSVSLSTQSLLLENNVHLIQKFKRLQFKRIAQLTGATIITNLKEIEHPSESLVGNCALFKNVPLKISNEANTNMLIFEASTPPPQFVTLVLSGPDESELKKLKVCLRRCITNLHDFVLEKDVIFSEIALYFTDTQIHEMLLGKSPRHMKNDRITFNEEAKGGLDPTLNELFKVGRFFEENIGGSEPLFNEKTCQSAGYFIDFSARRIKHEPTRSINYTKVNIAMINSRDHYDLQKMGKEELQQLEEMLFKDRTRKIDMLAQICYEPRVKKAGFYASKLDISLGKFLKMKVDTIFNPCDDCQRPRYYHTSFYYKGGGYVRISTEIAGAAKQGILNEVIRQSNRQKGKGSQLVPQERFSDWTQNYDEEEGGENPKESMARKNSQILLELENENNKEEEKEVKESTGFAGMFKNIFNLFGQKTQNKESKEHGPTRESKIFSHAFASESKKDKLGFLFSKKQQEKNKTGICLFIECNTCKKRLTDYLELSDSYLEYSFNRYLERLFASSQTSGFQSLQNSLGLLRDDSGSEGRAPMNTTSSMIRESVDQHDRHLTEKLNACCQRSSKSRVFKYDDVLVRITCGSARPYKYVAQCIINPKVEKIAKLNEIEKIKLQIFNYSSLFKSYLNFVINPLNTLIENLLGYAKLEITFDFIEQVHKLLNSNSPLTADPFVLLLRDLIPIRQKLIDLKIAADENFSAEFTDYLEIEKVRKLLFVQIYDLNEITYRIYNTFIIQKTLGQNMSASRKKKMLKKEKTKKSSISRAQNGESMNASRLSRNCTQELNATKKSPFSTIAGEYDGLSCQLMRNDSKIKRQSPHQLDDLKTNNFEFKLSMEENKSYSSSPPNHSETISQSIHSSIKTAEMKEPQIGKKRSEQIVSSNTSTFTVEGMRKSVDFRKDSAETESLTTASAFVIRQNRDPEDEEEINLLREITKGFESLDKENMYASNQKYDFIPVIEQEPLSPIAYAINSGLYWKKVLKPCSKFDEFSACFNLFFSFLLKELLLLEKSMNNSTQEFLEQIQSILLAREEQIFMIMTEPINVLYRGFHGIIKELSLELSGDRRQARDFLQDFRDFIDINVEPNPQYFNNIYLERLTTPKVEISVFYPSQFQALRLLCGIKHEDFIRSLASSQPWKDNSGGKSSATFIKSHDELYVFKALKKSEFNMLISMIYEYFEYLWENLKQPEKNASVLAKILGMYEITDKGTMLKTYYIAMENICYGFHPTRVYDLKGSGLNRYVQNPKPNQVLLDTNFKIDQNGEPIGVESSTMKKFLQAFKNDAIFLANRNRIDYSLLLAIDDKSMEFKIGITDYLREYTLDKQLEYYGKKVIKRATPTIIDPQNYMKRFLKTMNTSFMEIVVQSGEERKPEMQ